MKKNEKYSTIIYMSNEYPILQFLSAGTREIFGFTKGNFRFNGGDFYQLFTMRVGEIEKGIDLRMSPKDTLEYTKCYAVAVGSIINRWYKKPDTALDEEFQIKFFHEGIAYLSRYYEKKPQERFFDQFPNPPRTEKEEESIANWVIHKAEWYLKTVSKAWYMKLYKKQCINYDAVRNAKYEYKKKLDEGYEPKPVNVDDFRDIECWKQVRSGREGFDTYINSQSSTFDTHEFSLIEDFLDRFENGEPLQEDYDVESMVNRLRLDHSDRVKRLYSIFAINQIEEIKSASMWEINRIELDVESIQMIFFAMDYGYQLSLEGKQFLLLQYLRIAIEVFQHYENFSIDQEGIANLSPEQMIFLATVIGQTYTYFNNKYGEKIIKPLSKFKVENKTDEDTIKARRQEGLFRIISDFILKNINDRFQEYKTKKPQLAFNTMKKNIPNATMEYVLELDKVFGSFDNFNLFINKLIFQQSVSSLFENEEFIENFIPKIPTGELKEIVKSILSSLGYEILETGETETRVFYNGRGGLFKDQKLVDQKKRAFKSGVSFETGRKPSVDAIVDEYNLQRKDKVIFPTIISTEGFEEIEEDDHSEDEKLRKYSRSNKIGLLKLANLIKENYHNLPESEQQRIQSLIENLVIDF